MLGTMFLKIIGGGKDYGEKTIGDSDTISMGDYN